MLRARCAAVALLSLLVATFLGGLAPAATAGTGQFPAGQVTLNPGGGVNAAGTDGIRFVINDAGGYDQVYFRGTNQYCCSAGAPMLNVGGTLFGTGGPATSTADWTSLTVLSTTGSTSVGATTSATGDATAKVRYVATKGALEYVVDRTMTYTYPNNFVTETYDFTIPTGNTEQVRFYLGGDTSPGGTDHGYGVMLTSPVRSVISLNPSSQIQFGFSEVPGSKPFDGAVSRHFYSPTYGVVQAGGDLGFHVDQASHDAGLMIQWNLGSAPGTQTASMRSFANTQGTNLTASLSKAVISPAETLQLDLSLENTKLAAVAGLGYTFTLPANTQIAAGTPTNSCAGTLTATTGGTSVTLAGGTVAATTNCVVSVPITSSTLGTHTIGTTSVTATTTDVTNSVGTASFQVAIAPAITTTNINPLVVGTAASATITSTGTPAATYAVTTGTLPAGLTLNTTTGVISGTPTTAGAYSFTITATNVRGTDSQAFTGTVAKGTPSPTASATSPAYGTAPTLTVAGLPTAATGQVTFTSAGTILCTATLPAASCVGPDDLEPGSHTVVASYSGDANWEAQASAPATFTVTAAASTITGSLSSTATTYGTSVTVAATVTPASATGTITVSSGTTTLCTIELPATTCETTRYLGAGAHAVTVSYSGDTRYSASSAAAGTLEVAKAPTQIVVTGPFTTSEGKRTTIATSGLPAGATGIVTVRRANAEVCRFTVPAATSCATPKDLAVGSYPLTMTYSGDVNHLPSRAATTLTVTQAPDRLPLTGTSVLLTAPLGLALLATGAFVLWYRRRTVQD